jgi:hypothetical protein
MTESLQATESTTPEAVTAEAVTEDDAQVSSPAEDVKQEAEEGSDTGTETDDEAEKPKKEPTEADKVRHAMEKRLARKTASQKASEERVKQLEAQLAEVPKQADTSDAPQEDDFDSWADFNQATIKYEAKKLAQAEMRETKEAELNRQREVQSKERQKAFEAKESAFAKANPDYQDKSTVLNEVFDSHMKVNNGTTPTMQAVATLLAESDVSPALIHSLGSDDGMAEDLLNMSPMEAMRELFKLESAVSSKPQQTGKELPKPIKTLNGKSNLKKGLDNMSPKEVLEHFAKLTK